ncbi:MAG: peptidase M36 [Thermonema sp.]|uniref:T9SS-dependent M36 family metallopeptidase n=1 Tax=Thermonema sp. TaxID=2231181 RepID=UPI0021DD2E40|nr:T9SS-dependent M36 family metallopeptidase [Thermonema sp.]GIV38780.1 MAG: peptidase M36 [Thermonema sp.]
MRKIVLLSLGLLLTLLASLSAQQLPSTRVEQLNGHFRLSTSAQDWEVTHHFENNGVEYWYFRRMYQGIPVFNQHVTAVFRKGELLHAAGDPTDLKNVQATKAAALDAAAAFAKILQYAEADTGGWETAGEHRGNGEFVVYRQEKTGVRSVLRRFWWQEEDGSLRLVWAGAAPSANHAHWWEVLVDASNGDMVQRFDWAAHDHWELCLEHSNRRSAAPVRQEQATVKKKGDGAKYNVFALPLESPNHGSRSLVTDPADPTASPYGWHDVNGAAGAEYTITRGNNVYAYEDSNADNAPGYSPDGGASLNFDFPLDMGQQRPDLFQDAVITNLFYWNNIIHDVFYHYGFDEVSGNFQQNNYGRGGQAGDAVNAEAQDGSGTNNANFATPPDGTSPRMQMYLWVGNVYDVEITAPASIAGEKQTSRAQFGKQLSELSAPITAEVVLADDGVDTTTNACSPLVNNVSGKIVLIDRGACTFVTKVKNAQNAGAVAVIVANYEDALLSMGGEDATINIPVVMIKKSDGDAIKTALSNNQTVTATIRYDARALDSDLDNGIIVHEYGHGISTRLTGGAAVSSCLNNEEQMGEGWSDWFALMLTMKAGDTATDPRGIGTFAAGQPTTGVGIRPAPYTTDMSVNGFTYADLPNQGLSVPHGVGFVWATMLWDLTWKFIDLYGFDSDLINGNGGNNKVLKLVVEALKMQPCNPGFVDGRDAILAADKVLYNGAHEQIIWDVFARRGLGWSASQGSSNSRSDGTAAFDVPPACRANAGYIIPPAGAEQCICGWRLARFSTQLLGYECSQQQPRHRLQLHLPANCRRGSL